MYLENMRSLGIQTIDLIWAVNGICRSTSTPTRGSMRRHHRIAV